MGCFFPIPWITAQPNQIPLVLSEDFKDGFALDGVCFVNFTHPRLSIPHPRFAAAHRPLTPQEPQVPFRQRACDAVVPLIY